MSNGILPDPAARTVVVSANTSWNILNFRSGLLRGLKAAGYAPVVVAPSDEYTPRLIAEGHVFQPITIDRAGMNPVADARLVRDYRRILRETGAAAYLGFTIKPNIYGAIAARLAGVPAIANVSGLGTTFLSRAWLSRLAIALYRFGFRRAHRVFFQNRDDRELFVGNGIVRPGQAGLLPGSGIDLDRFEVAPDREAGAPLTFLFIGRLLRDKGVREYVEAARLLRDRLPGASFRILGDLDPGNRSAIAGDELRSWVEEGAIAYLGPAEDVRPHIAAADAVVLPSYREGMPRVLLEGAAMGRPLVATDVPGCREIAEEGVTGTLCAVRDPASLAEAMARLAALAPERRRALGLAARNRIEQQFSEQTVVRAYLDVLDELCGRTC